MLTAKRKRPKDVQNHNKANSNQDDYGVEDIVKRTVYNDRPNRLVRQYYYCHATDPTKAPNYNSRHFIEATGSVEKL